MVHNRHKQPTDHTSSLGQTKNNHRKVYTTSFQFSVSGFHEPVASVKACLQLEKRLRRKREGTQMILATSHLPVYTKKSLKQHQRSLAM
jgi:hypothetical protein